MAWIEQRKGRYVGYYRDAAGNKHRAGSSTLKREAKSLAEDEEAKIRSGDWHDPRAGKVTFSNYFEHQWFPHRQMSRNNSSTYKSHYNSELRDAWGEHLVNEITQAMVQRWVNDMLTRGVSPATAVAKYKALATILGAQKGVSAVFDGLIKTSPCSPQIQLPRVPKKRAQNYEVGEVDLLVRELGPWWAPIPLLAADTAYRWGELMGLLVSDFSHDFQTVTLHRSITEGSKATSGNGTAFAWKATDKGDHVSEEIGETIAITPDAAAAMERLVKDRQLFPADRLFSMPTKERHTRQLPPGTLPRRSAEWPMGVPISRNFFRDSIWLPAHEKLGIKERKFHALRGSHLTWMLAGGADLMTVQERGRHANIKTTQGYLAAMQDTDRRALDALERTRTRSRASGED